MAIHRVTYVIVGEKEWSGEARSYVWRDEYSYDDKAGDFVVEHWKSYSDARSASPPLRTHESTTRVALTDAPAEVLDKLRAMGLGSKPE
jgi:hypothetical protein